jgi:restriction endonuclease S subunit
MSDEWAETTLGEVADYINGYPFKPADLNGSQIPVIRIKQLLDVGAEVDYTDLNVPDKVLISDGDLIFSWSGSLASRIWDRGNAALNQHLFRVVEKPGVSRGWLHLALDHAVNDLMDKTHGTTMKHVTKGVLESHRVALPPLVVQRRIVDLMTHLDNHLTNLRTERETAAEIRRSMLGNLLARDVSIPGEYDSLLSEVNASSQQTLRTVESTIGDEWIEATLGETSLITIGRTPPRKERKYWTTDLTNPFCTIADMDALMLNPSREGVTQTAITEGKAKRVPAGSLLMSFKLTIGRVGFATRDIYPNEAIAWIKVTDSRVNERFLALWLGSQDLTAGSGRAVKGDTLNSESLRAISFPVPSLAVQRRIVDLMTHLGDLEMQLDDEIRRNVELRSALLSLLLSDQVSIPDSYDSLLMEVA